jgi:hypothetical protein
MSRTKANKIDNSVEYYITAVGQSKAPLYGIYSGIGHISLTVFEGNKDTDISPVELTTKATPTNPPQKIVFPAATQGQLMKLYEDARYGGSGGFNGVIGKREVRK